MLFIFCNFKDEFANEKELRLVKLLCCFLQDDFERDSESIVTVCNILLEVLSESLEENNAIIKLINVHTQLTKIWLWQTYCTFKRAPISCTHEMVCTVLVTALTEILEENAAIKILENKTIWNVLKNCAKWSKVLQRGLEVARKMKNENNIALVKAFVSAQSKDLKDQNF